LRGDLGDERDLGDGGVSKKLQTASKKLRTAPCKQEAASHKQEAAHCKQEAENCKLHPSPVSPRSPASPKSPSPTSPSPHNPDVLTCLANLSNDEVFTPPQMANNLLDLLPGKIWEDKNATFLDPCCKSGVFLREIVKRLNEGLKAEIPDLQKRVNHILTRQVFGLAITEMTGLLSRRSVYCSKAANEKKYSLCTVFKDDQGNIRFNPKKHTWSDGRCVYCGASEAAYKRDDGLESHAYAFIHTENPEELFKMKFDVIVGNPPYQLSSNNDGIQATPLYHKFVEQAKKLGPRYLSMIIPSRWFAGGMGLADFRRVMLSDGKIRNLVDFPKSRDCFPEVDIAGGVCYFLWDRDNKGDCEFTSMFGKSVRTRNRDLNEFDGIFIRDNIGIDIVHKITKEGKLSETVFPISPFGLSTKERGENSIFNGAIKLISSAGETFIKPETILKNIDVVRKYKVIIGQLNPDRAGVNNATDGKMNVVTRIRILNPNEVHTATYLLLGAFDKKDDAERFRNFIATKFVRYLISLTLSSMHITRESFRFVPTQDFSEDWTDARLYKKYGLAKEEIEFIESMIRPMGLGDRDAEGT